MLRSRQLLASCPRYVPVIADLDEDAKSKRAKPHERKVILIMKLEDSDCWKLSLTVNPSGKYLVSSLPTS